MSGNLRLILEHVSESGEVISREVAKDYHITKPSHIDDIGLNHLQQLSLVQTVADKLIFLQSKYINEYSKCPKCGFKAEKTGKSLSHLSAISTDHKVPLQKYRCRKCGWTSSDSLKKLYGSSAHTDLIKMQAELGSTYSFRKSIAILEMFSGNKKRKVNNRETIKKVTNAVGEIIEEYNKSDVTDNTFVKASELILHLDGAHIKSNKKGSRSFEALSATIYEPKDIQKIGKHKNIITRKSCVASAKDDNQDTMKIMLINAAKRHGMTEETKLTALSDGAQNCKAVILALGKHCGEIEQILDWFHIAKRFQNIISGASNTVANALENAKWKLWHGKAEEAVDKLIRLQSLLDDSKKINKVKKLIGYLRNNTEILVNYDVKDQSNSIYTSSIAESTVEAMINSRYRQSGKMQWSKESSHKSLQVRAAKYCNVLDKLWKFITSKLLSPTIA